MTIEQLRRETPLVVCITNDVVKDFTANGMLALGASPIMSGEKSEAEDLMKVASGLLINIGTADENKKSLMQKMVSEANKNNVPVILDPVGYGASSFRRTLVDNLIEDYDISLIKGNAGEIYSLAGGESASRGVDSIEETDTKEIAELCYKKLNIPILVTGETDAFVSSEEQLTMTNGHELLGKITGAGCLLGSVITAFVAVEKTVGEAVTNAVSYYNLCAERAGEALTVQAPASFRTAFIDQLYINDDDIYQDRRVNVDE
jgi:hydroxyethylthiazole kinase